jgi:hypothetical protein
VNYCEPGITFQLGELLWLNVIDTPITLITFPLGEPGDQASTDTMGEGVVQRSHIP